MKKTQLSCQPGPKPLPSFAKARRWLNVFIAAIFSILISLVPNTALAANWWDADWSKCRDITIANTGSETLENFPAYISLDYYADMKSKHEDIRFINTSCNNNGTELKFEIESFSGTSANVWVNIDNLPAAGKTIAVYYGNASEGSGEDVNNTWSLSGHQGVWHLDKLTENTENTDKTYKNSASNVNHGIPKNSPASTGGKIGNSLNFGSAVNTNLAVGIDNSLKLSRYNNWTISMWVKPSSFSGNQYPVMYTYGDYGASVGLDKDTGRIEHWRSDDSEIHSTSRLTIGVWHHVVVVYKKGAKTDFYVNGTKNVSIDSEKIKNDNKGSYIGGYSGPGYEDGYSDADLIGLIDEVRVSNTSRTAQWIKQSYEMVQDQAGHVTIGAEVEPDYPLTGSLHVDNSFEAYISTDDTVQGTLLTSGTDWPTLYNLASELTPGQDYYLHIKGTDVGGEAGFLGHFELKNTDLTFSNGLTTLNTNTTDWVVSTTGWGGYTAATSYGVNGVSPWDDNTAGIDASAQWIWSSNNETDNVNYFSTKISKEAPRDMPTPKVDYRFDQCRYVGNKIIDQQGNYDGIVHGLFNSVSTAVVNNALDLSSTSTNDWVSVPNTAVDGLDDFTFSIWLNTSKDKDQQEIFHALGNNTNDDELEIHLQSDNEVVVKIQDREQVLNSAINLTNGLWHHLAVTRVNDKVCLFVDGGVQSCLTGARSGQLDVPTDNAVVIGQEQDSFSGYFSASQSFEGYLDEFKLFGQKLSDDEIRSLYSNELSGVNFDGSTRAAINCNVPTAEYRFDEMQYNDVENEVIESIGGLHGQAKGAQPVDGKVCNAVDLSATGTSDYVLLDKDILTNKKDFSVSLWAKTSKKSSQSLLSGASYASFNELIMWFENDTLFGPYLKGKQSDHITTASIANNTWHHLVWTRSGSNLCFYRDKVMQGNCVTTTTNLLDIESLILGQEQDWVGGGFNPGQAFDGLIDELLIFDNGVTATQIAQIYDNQNNGLNFDGSARVCSTINASIDDAVVLAGDKADFTVTLESPATSDVVVTYSTADSTALEGVDYTPATGSITIVEGQSSGTISIDTLDADQNNDVVFTVTISSTDVTLIDAVGQGTVQPLVKISIDDVTVLAGLTADFTVTLKLPATSDVLVSYSTSNITALAGVDYIAVPTGSITIASGQSTGTISIATLDGNQAGDVRFQLAISSADASITDATGVGTITPIGLCWTPADISTELWLDASDAATITASPLTGQLGLLNLTANGGTNPATGNAWVAGDTYRLVFVSSTTTPATSTDMTYYNTHVQDAASAAGFGAVTWKAIGSTAAVNAKDNTNSANGDTDGAFLLVDGATIISNNIADFWDGNHTSAQAIDIDESGTGITGIVDPTPWYQWQPAWTGTNGDGTAAPGSELGAAIPKIGLAHDAASAAQWTSRSSATNTWSMHVYAMSEVLTVGHHVSQWKDKSGNNNHATQATVANQPKTGTRTIGGLNVFDYQTNNWFDFTTINMVGKQAWAVFKIDDLAGDFTVLGHSGNSQMTILTTGKMRLWANTSPYNPTDTGASQTLVTGIDYVGGWLAHDTTKQFSLDGVLTDNAGTYVSPRTQNHSKIGRSQYTTDTDGMIGEIIITSAELSTEERQKMEGYLAKKWGLEAKLPAGHPGVCGSSLTAKMEYRFDEASWDGTAGELINNSMDLLHGQSSGGTLSQDGQICRAATFDGVDDHFSLPAISTDFRTGLSAMAWVDFNDAQSWERVLDFSNGQANNNIILARNGTSDDLTFEIYNGSATCGKTTASGAILSGRHHYAVTLSPARAVVLYRDGVTIASGSSTCLPANVTRTQNYIGRSVWGHDGYFDSQIDELKVFDSGLSATRIAEIYNNEQAGNNYDGSARSCPRALDHYAITHNSPGLTCEGAQITVTAHDVDHVDYNVSSNTALTVSTSKSVDRILSSPATIPPTIPSGSASTTFYLQHSAVLSKIDIDVTDGIASDLENASDLDNPEAEDREFNFLDTAFRFYVGDDHTATTPIGVQVAGVLSSQNLFLKAVRSNTDTGACEAAFQGVTTNVEMAYECNNPTACTARDLLDITGASTPVTLAPNNNGSTGNYTGVSLAFNASGLAPFKFNYKDAGQITLHAKKSVAESSPDPAFTLKGNSNAFWTRPAKLVVTAKSGTKTLDNTTTSFDADHPIHKAGVDFTLEVTAQNAHGQTTPNYQPEETAFAFALTRTGPTDDDAVNGHLTYNTGQPVITSQSSSASFERVNLARFNQGISTNVAKYSEVGLLQLDLQDVDYANTGFPVDGDAINIGRFTPDHFTVTASADSFDDFCGVGADGFTYIGQPFSYINPPEITITAVNLAGIPTKNYTQASYQKLTDADDNIRRTFAVADKTTCDSEGKKPNGDCQGEKMAVTPSFSPGNFNTDKAGAGIMTYEFAAGDTFTYSKGANSEVNFFTASYEILLTQVKDSDQVSSFTDFPDTPLSIDKPLSIIPTGVNLRFGRLVIENSFGPETADLSQPMRVEYLNDGNYTLATGDACTPVTAANMTRTPDKTPVDGDNGVFIDGKNNRLFITAPGQKKTFDVEYEASSWLKFDWNGDGNFDNNPTGTATFGLYRGNDRIIYWREIHD